MTQLVNGYYSPENPELFRPLYDSLMYQDQYFILKDFDSYCEAHRRVDAAYRNESAWARSAMLNTAKCGKFTADRTIEEYAKDIWKMK
jgi:starch phosphorylase